MASMRKIFIGFAVFALLLNAGEAYAYRYTYTAIDYPGASYTTVEGINNSGEVVGSFQISVDGSVVEEGGYAKNGTGFTPLNVNFRIASGINNSGWIVGMTWDYRGCLKVDDTYEMFDFPGIPYCTTFPHGINDSGWIVGEYTPGIWFTSYGFLKIGSAYISLLYPPPPDTQDNRAMGINNSGHIVGSYYEGREGYVWGVHGYLKVGDTYCPIDYPGLEGPTYATGINNSGHIVGYYGTTDIYTNRGTKGFLKVGDTYTTIDFPGAFSTEVYGINDSGQIAGTYTLKIVGTLYYHGFIATPVKESLVPIIDLLLTD